ncbi:MAG TPA: TIGR03862 family flavoprotein [Bacteroidia bacterium]|jgi:uncharacterized flavoprotein (TIGR03862 family)|nr:TIGR03862 family flavoprotein [Bacteroidia bacterium]
MKIKVTIIGSGPAGLMAAARLDEKKFEVTVYEKNSAPARKFLVAGSGGFNLTHSEPFEQLIKRYTPSSFIDPIIRSFTNVDLQVWLKTIGIPTFTGTSRRIFPEKGIKPIAVLNAILKVLKDKNVKLVTGYNWQGEKMNSDINVFALGGSSWKITGSDGSWTNYFQEHGIEIIPFQASNCAFKIDWPKNLKDLAAGLPLKNVCLESLNIKKLGEVVITEFGMEGSAIYALSPQIRQQLNEHPKAICYIDLKPSLNMIDVIQLLEKKPADCTMTKYLDTELNLSKTHLALLKNLTTKEDFLNPEKLANKIKRLPLEITGMAPIDQAISTVGGISLNEIDKNFQLKKLPGNYVIGEMLDWDAPTGGYLLQACFSMGHNLGEYLNKLESPAV